MSNVTLDDQIEMLRTQLESSLPFPVVLIVSSARNDDGKGLLAAGLASSMGTAGYSTLLVLAGEQVGEIDVPVTPKSLSELSDLGLQRFAVRAASSSASLIVVPSARIRHTVSRESVTRFVETCHASYQVTIVEVGAILTNAFATLLSVAADGVLLTIREGRRVCADDRKLAKALERDQAPFLGVVAIGALPIREERLRGMPRPVTPGASMPTGGLEAGRTRRAV